MRRAPIFRHPFRSIPKGVNDRIADPMTISKLRSVVRGVGAYLPERVLTNAELAGMVETSDEWIQQRTGIRQRRIAAPGETTSQLATKAALAALGDAGLTGADIDLIVVATSTPDYTF